MGIFFPNNNNENTSPELKLPLKNLNMKKTPDQFLCHLCENVPEILRIHSDYGIIEFKCFKHEAQESSIDKYIEDVKKSQFYCPNLKCECNLKNDEQKFKFCQVCKKDLCENCLNSDICLNSKKSNIKKRISIGEKNNKCPNHYESDITDFCFDCQENYCKNDKEHKAHNTIKTKDLLEEASKYEEIIERKNNNLYYIAKLCLSINNKNKNAQNNQESVNLWEEFINGYLCKTDSKENNDELNNNINQEKKNQEEKNQEKKNQELKNIKVIELIPNYLKINEVVEEKKKCKY